MTFGEQVKKVRLQLHISQTDFADLIGVNFTTVNRWEKGKSNPSFKAIRAFETLCKQKRIKISE